MGGSPGSGKSRLARSVADGLHREHGINAEYISLGDRLRLIGRQVIWSAHQDQITDHVTDPDKLLEPIDSAIIERVVGDALADMDTARADVVLLDGYPKYIDQVEGLAYLALLSGRKLPGALITTVDEETALSRMLMRGRKHTERAMTDEQAIEKLRRFETTYPQTLHELNTRIADFTVFTIDTSGPREITARLGMEATLRLIGEKFPRSA